MRGWVYIISVYVCVLYNVTFLSSSRADALYTPGRYELSSVHVFKLKSKKCEKERNAREKSFRVRCYIYLRAS